MAELETGGMDKQSSNYIAAIEKADKSGVKSC